MPTDRRSMPRTRTSAPVEPPRTTKDPTEHEGEESGSSTRQAGDERGDRGDRMPRGADEPGAGL
jgi:hypothetical protein